MEQQPKIYETFKDLVKRNDINKIKAIIKANSKMFETYDIRRNARMFITRNLNLDIANELLPSRLNKTRTSRNKDAVDAIIKGADIEAELEYIKNVAKSQNAANVSISLIKKELEIKGHKAAAEEIKHSAITSEAMAGAAEEQEESRARLSDIPFYIHPNFAFENVHKRLNGYITSIKDNKPPAITNAIIADTMILLAARPSELFNLKISGDGMISGQSKAREAQTSYKYIGILDAGDAKLLLEYIQKFPEFAPVGVSRSSVFSRFMKQFGDETTHMTPSALRKIGGEYASMTETNKYKRIKKRQQALRHKRLETSIMHYDITDKMTS